MARIDLPLVWVENSTQCLFITRLFPKLPKSICAYLAQFLYTWNTITFSMCSIGRSPSSHGGLFKISRCRACRKDLPVAELVAKGGRPFCARHANWLLPRNPQRILVDHQVRTRHVILGGYDADNGMLTWEQNFKAFADHIELRARKTPLAVAPPSVPSSILPWLRGVFGGIKF
jgi:hypothetical protein